MLSFNVACLKAESQFIYFGYVPSKIQDRTTAQLYVVGCQDGTSVTVYSLPNLQVLGQFTVDRMNKNSLPVSNGTWFKVVSDKPATVILAGGKDLEASVTSISTFYTSVEGGYLGQEFIFPSFADEEGSGVYTVYALQDAQVTVYNETAEVTSFKLAPNEFKDMSLKASEVYRLTSTGYVMLQSFSEMSPVGWQTTWKSHMVPSLEGTFLGEHFYERSINPGSTEDITVGGNLDFLFISGYDVKVSMYDIKVRNKVTEYQLTASQQKALTPNKQQHLFFESNNLATLMVLGNQGGLIVGGLKAGQSAYINVQTEESYVFAYDKTTLNLDDLKFSVLANAFFQLPTGIHKLEADKTIIFVIVHYIGSSYFTSFGACLPSIQSMELTYPKIDIQPIEAGFPMTYIIVGAIAAVAVVVIGILVIKRRPKK